MWHTLQQGRSPIVVFLKCPSDQAIRNAPGLLFMVKEPAPSPPQAILNSKPVELLRFIELLENELGMEAKKKLLPLQPGDVIETCADITDLDVANQLPVPHEREWRLTSWLGRRGLLSQG